MIKRAKRRRKGAVKENSNENGQSIFIEILKKAYDKGRTENGMTSKKMIEELKVDLKNMPIAQSDTI
ncbi:hypothetical protein [Neobacillus piezotolerans]|uniref:hypothetical protein n=1 Tax=Neobacillus piezotolerans TaxID=2259171 RepID=UPI001159348F|nr:hypothetical protein [Neobacillus piezotolerans]